MMEVERKFRIFGYPGLAVLSYLLASLAVLPDHLTLMCDHQESQSLRDAESQRQTSPSQRL
jgi:hypothetical protein